MSRSHFWQRVLNSDGVPISGAVVTLFDEEDDSQVSFYTKESSASPTTFTTTSSSGLFEMWVPDRTELGGYGTNTTFTLIVSGADMDTRQINGIQLLFRPPRFCEFDMFSRLTLYSEYEHLYSLIIPHDLNTEHPCIQAWNTQTRQTMEVSCSSISVSALSVSAYYESEYYPQDSIPVRIVLLGEDT